MKALYLIDPVNGDPRFAPESADYPSAVRALTGKGWRIGITGELCTLELLGHTLSRFECEWVV